jgi:D-alanine-D-alanine ligase
MIVKPAREGSTIGLTKVLEAGEIAGAIALATRYDPLVMAEEFVTGEELTASVLGDTALPLVRIVAPEGNYDYRNKYFTDDTKYYCPSGVDAALEEQVRAVTLKSFRVLGCRGWGRADLILRPDGSFAFLEMNTSPGMTGHSLVPMAAKAAGMDYADLCLRILEGAALDNTAEGGA